MISTFFCETWACDHEKEITGYKHIFQNGFKTPGVKTGRSSGGLLLYVKEYLSKQVTILKETPYSFWLEIDCSIFTNLDQNLVISAQYIPPVSSKYYGQNTIENLRGDLLKFCDETTPVILIGDFNARTGNISDNLDIDQNFDYSGLEQTEFLPRNNCDKQDNAQGQHLIDTLQARNLKILNGRTSGEFLGNFTTFKNGHASVNDYGNQAKNYTRMSKILSFFSRRCSQTTQRQLFL